MKTIQLITILCLCATISQAQNFQFGGSLFVNTNYFSFTEHPVLEDLDFSSTIKYTVGAGINVRFNHKTEAFFLDFSINYQNRSLGYGFVGSTLAERVTISQAIVFDEYMWSIKSGFPFKKIYPFIGFSIASGNLSGHSFSSFARNTSVNFVPTSLSVSNRSYNYLNPYIDIGVETADLQLMEKLISKAFIQFQLSPKKLFQSPLEIEIETGTALELDYIQGYLHSFNIGMSFYI